MPSTPETRNLECVAPLQREPQEWRYRNAMRLWFVNAMVALVIVGAYAISRRFAFALVGLFWLLIGGLLNIGAIVNGCIYFGTARALEYGAPHTRRRAMSALWLPLSNILLAALCVAAGRWMIQRFEPHFGDGD